MRTRQPKCEDDDSGDGDDDDDICVLYIFAATKMTTKLRRKQILSRALEFARKPLRFDFDPEKTSAASAANRKLLPLRSFTLCWRLCRRTSRILKAPFVRPLCVYVCVCVYVCLCL